ncbi:YjbQ family protein [Candidatus Saccharibacteria bacterium]|nr:YjbQ family protein [Candidatus Saccharibacteria bacterium]
MEKITVTTKKPKEIIDITNEINRKLKSENASSGLCHLFASHTTCALTTADLDPGTDQDMLDAFEEMVPKLPYHHPHNPSHVGDHIMSSVLGPSVTIPVENGQLVLGTWQRVVLIELYGPREREVIVSFLKEEDRN